MQLSLDDLMRLEVSTVSRKTEALWSAPGAIDVLTDEDIRRSGVFHLPDALRLAAGVHVGQPNAREWAVGIRGFNVTSGNKLNVQMDGRSVFTPFFSGVLWDAQNTLLEDIDRIEIMRGPAGALWGSYATNGFIQILTKPAWATQGTLVMGAAGTEMPGAFAVRHGGKVDDNTFYRVYAKYAQFDWTYDANGRHTQAATDFGQVGFRADGRRQANAFTLQGDVYTNKGLLKDRQQNEISGGNLTGHWTRDLGADADLRVTSYYDYTSKRFLAPFYERRHSFSGAVKYHAVRGVHDFQLGADVLGSRDNVEGGTIFLDPPRRTFASGSLFGHDMVTLIPKRLTLTVGAQALYTNFSGWEVQPTIRGAWMPSARTTIWAAVSRAVRTPIRLDEDIVLVEGSRRVFEGNDDLKPERVTAYELGGRFKPNERLAFTLAGFVNRYNDVRSYESIAPNSMEPPWTFKNTTNVNSGGVETMIFFQPHSRVFMKATYRYLDFNLTKDPGSGDFQNGIFEGNDPRHVGTLSVRVDLPRNVELDLVGRGASRLPNPTMDGYVTMDARLAWRPRPEWEVAVIGRDLTEPQRRDFVTPTRAGEEIGRSVTLKTTWRF